jgi:SAM-dependent methyltransferase
MLWFENDDFWRTFYPWMFHERRFAGAETEVDGVIALSGVEQGAVLDLCCGPARHSLALSKKGFRVTAVDASEFLLGKARERAEGSPIEFVRSDMRAFRREDSFDLAINLFTSFGYFEDRAEDLRVLENVHASLKKGGVFIMDVMGRECVARLPCSTAWEQSPDGDIWIDHAEILPGWSNIRTQWLLVKPDRTLRYELQLNLYSGQELSDALTRAGFSDVQIFGSLNGTPYDRTATRLAVRAVK